MLTEQHIKDINEITEKIIQMDALGRVIMLNNATVLLTRQEYDRLTAPEEQPAAV